MTDQKKGLRLVGSNPDVGESEAPRIGTLAGLINALGSVGITDVPPEDMGLMNIVIIVEGEEEMSIVSLDRSVPPHLLLATLSQAEFNLNLGILNGAGYDNDE